MQPGRSAIRYVRPVLRTAIATERHAVAADTATSRSDPCRLGFSVTVIADAHSAADSAPQTAGQNDVWKALGATLVGSNEIDFATLSRRNRRAPDPPRLNGSRRRAKDIQPTVRGSFGHWSPPGQFGTSPTERGICCSQRVPRFVMYHLSRALPLRPRTVRPRQVLLRQDQTPIA